MTSPTILSVIILTYNEEEALPDCLASLRGLDADIYVVDSGSTDRTQEIARKAGCHILEHSFENYASQLNWALEHISIGTPWIMRLDADERLMTELAMELKSVLPSLPNEVTGLLIKRRVYFWGTWIRHGGYYPIWLLRVWRTGSARCEERWMDEHMVLMAGKANRLKKDLIDENLKGLTFWTDKHNRYADREARDLLVIGGEKHLSGAGAQAGRRRWFKKNVYARSPLFFRAFLYWVYRYFMLLGFLDGRAGLVFHFLQGFWYRFLVDAKLYELKVKAKRDGRKQ